MRIKNLFDDLKANFRKKYICKNGEEILIFTNNDFEIEIFHYADKLDIVLSNNGYRNNYLESSALDSHQKLSIKSTIQSCTSLEVKCKTISKVLLSI